jgi:EmrB/QacA subfamily drug resistance transporter
LAAPEKSDGPGTPRRLGLILGLLVTAQFIVILDFSIVQIALPTIRADLQMSLADLQWIISAYGLTFAGFLMLSGRASDIYGRKTLFMAGLVVFSFSSLAGGLAPSEQVLIAARVAQGIGAALCSATGLAMIVRVFAPLGRLNQVLGIFTAVSASGFSAGIVLGGVLTEALGWRWIFFVNVPIGIATSLLAIKFLPDARESRKEQGRLDVPGAVAVTGGLMLLVYGLTDVGNGDTSYLTYLVLAAAAAVLASFIAIERYSAAPLMPLGFLRRRTIFFANATTLLTYASFVVMIFLVTTYLQVLRSYSPLYAAAAILPGSLLYLVIGGFAAPRLVKRLGAKTVLVAAMVALLAGMLLFTQISLGSSFLTAVLPAQLVAVIGGSLAATASNIAALSGARPGEEGIASGLINTSRQVGGPIGLAVSVTVIGLATHGLGVSAPSGEVITAFRYAFDASAGFAALAVATALLLKGRPAQSSQAQPSGQASPAR